MGREEDKEPRLEKEQLNKHLIKEGLREPEGTPSEQEGKIRTQEN